ncbi:uncharacterized protein LOC118183101 isoform X2 [Stegodyphus dumicola]|uniref:uncharacterized protein LOC118183101 isoform X2 n=1 Tax=Stegodyphus dumicola TaxID=202533 RepID=UPI0015A83531|nr:uncharacterized protein LOC118183101 isoform X2 [Stegodyphus dumicola]
MCFCFVMFSNQVNSRDLFYSNPIDHFLVQDATQKISRESGFSSSFSRNQSGNSKDLYQYSGSEDLFSHTENSNMYDSQPASHKLDYQKYISQNLILGKINKSPETTSVNKQTADKDLKKNSNFRACLSDTEFINQSEMKEIRDLFRSLTAVIQKLNVDVLIVKDNVKDIKDEISRQNENFESFKDILGKQERKLNEVEISLEKCNQKQDEYYADLKCIARGTNENVENMIVEVRDGIQCGSKVSESIKKILSAHENSHKKFLCDAKNQNKSIISVENTTCKIQSAIEAIPKNLNKFVDKFEQKTKELQTAICAVKETAERNVSIFFTH